MDEWRVDGDHPGGDKGCGPARGEAQAQQVDDQDRRRSQHGLDAPAHPVADPAGQVVGPGVEQRCPGGPVAGRLEAGPTEAAVLVERLGQGPVGKGVVAGVGQRVDDLIHPEPEPDDEDQCQQEDGVPPVAVQGADGPVARGCRGLIHGGRSGYGNRSVPALWTAQQHRGCQHDPYSAQAGDHRPQGKRPSR